VSPGSMLSWASTVGSKQQSGSLTWNENGTLQQLAIQDTANISDPQTCTYLYDDLERIGGSSTTPGVNCVNGSQNVWQQMFTYDAFGNINKSGNSSFQALYTANNQISNLGFVYDSNGNVTNDGANTYTYNVYNRPVTAGGNSATYDAFNRLVEVGGGSNTQIVYAPDGFKFAYMNGQTVSKYLVPLAAGVQAVYTAATPAAPAYWMHSDWLSSVRLTSAPNQTTVAGQAYAPFGEGYGTYFHGGVNDFTGQTQDVVSGIYDFTFRQYSPVQGRWQTPDPSGISAVDITNPQTWNRYEYANNNPLSNIDPLGLDIDDCNADFSDCPWWDWPWSGTAIPCWYCFGRGQPPSNQPPMQQPSNQPPMQQPINFPNETLGLPNGFPTNPWGIWGAIIPTADCGAITCVTIGNPFTDGTPTSGGLGGALFTFDTWAWWPFLGAQNGNGSKPPMPPVKPYDSCEGNPNCEERNPSLSCKEIQQCNAACDLAAAGFVAVCAFAPPPWDFACVFSGTPAYVNCHNKCGPNCGYSQHQ